MSSTLSNFLLYAILISMKHTLYRVSYIKHDEFYLSEYEMVVYHSIFKETMLKNRRCAQLSLSDLHKMTGLGKSTIDNQLKYLEKKRLIEIDNTHKTNTICFVSLYRGFEWGRLRRGY